MLKTFKILEGGQFVPPPQPKKGLSWYAINISSKKLEFVTTFKSSELIFQTAFSFKVPKPIVRNSVDLKLTSL